MFKALRTVTGVCKCPIMSVAICFLLPDVVTSFFIILLEKMIYSSCEVHHSEILHAFQ